MANYEVKSLILMFGMAYFTVGIYTSKPLCRIKCGVLTEQEGNTSFLDLVNSVWIDLQESKNLHEINITFEAIRPRWDQSMPELLDAYIDLGSANVSAVLGVYMHAMAVATERLDVPYFVTTDMTVDQFKPDNVISILPTLDDVTKITLQLIEYYKWTNVAVFYETMDGMLLVEALLQNTSNRVRAWRVDSETGPELIRQFLLGVRQVAVRHLLLLTSPQITDMLLMEGLKLSMLSMHHSWIIACLDRPAPDVMSYSYTAVKLTTLRLAQMDTARRVVDSGVYTAVDYGTVYDSLLTLYHGVLLHRRRRRNCLWSGQGSIRSTLTKIADVGATGNLSFRGDGSREGYQVQVMGLEESGLNETGVWRSSSGTAGGRLQMSRPPDYPRDKAKYPLGKDVVSVVIILEDPFVRLHPNHKRLKGNARYEGFCVDMLEMLASDLGFRYQLYLVPDGHYGELQPDGTWNGLIGEVAKGSASLVVAALSITSTRESAIDFTKPFKADGISIVMRRPAQRSSFFQFTEPLSGVVWSMMLGALFCTSVMLYALDRLAPPEDLSARFTCHESFWFTMANMLRKGTELQPRTPAAKTLAGGLWLFTLIIVSTYIASLAAHLTVSKFDNDIKSLFDLVEQSKVKYGTVSNSDVGAFFRNNKIPRFEQLWQMMSEVDPGSMVNSSTVGFRMVRDKSTDYAFIWDTPAVRFQIENDCDLMEIGNPIGERAYGIGVPLGAQYRDDISMAILQMAENGELTALEKKWWTSSAGCPSSGRDSSGKTTALTVEKFGGVFMILAIGTVLAITLSSLDYVIRTKTCQNNKQLRRYHLAAGTLHNEDSSDRASPGPHRDSQAQEEPQTQEKAQPQQQPGEQGERVHRVPGRGQDSTGLVHRQADRGSTGDKRT